MNSTLNLEVDFIICYSSELNVESHNIRHVGIKSENAYKILSQKT